MPVNHSDPAAVETAAKRGEASLREYLAAALRAGTAPEALEEALTETMRASCLALFPIRSYLSESLLLAHSVEAGRAYLREQCPGLCLRPAGELLAGCQGSVWLSPYHTAVWALARALGYVFTDLGCGVSPESLPEVWQAHPGAEGLLLYEGCLLAPDAMPRPWTEPCCLGRSRILAALPGAGLESIDALPEEQLSGDVGLLFQLADMLG